MTAEQAIKLVEILATIITAYFVYKSRQDIGEVKVSNKETLQKVDVVIDKASTIENSTNGHYGMMAAEIKELRLKSDAMQRLLDMMAADKRTAQTVAEKLADRAATPQMRAPTAGLPTLTDVVIEGTLETKE